MESSPPPETSAERFLRLFTKFRKTPWFRVFYVGVLIWSVVGLYVLLFQGSAVACLALLLIPIWTFILPYFLGERRVKHLLLNALPVFVIAILIVSAFQTDATVNLGPVNLASTTWSSSLPPLSLWNGSVAPPVAPTDSPAPHSFTFRVRVLTGPAVNQSTVSVFANLTQLSSTSGSPFVVRLAKDGTANNTNGTWYVATPSLGSDPYAFYFYANDTRGNWTATAPILEPITASWGAYYGLWAIGLAGSEFTIIAVIFYLLIVFMVWYSARNRQLRQRMRSQETLDKLEASKEKDNEVGPAKTEVSSKAASKAAAFTCTNCGADVTEDDKKCPKCGAVFED